MRPTLFGLALAILIIVSPAAAQAGLERLAAAVSRGDVEQKRAALFQIRNLRSESASRLAIPALQDPNVLVRSTAVSSVIFLPPEEAADLLIPMLDDRDEFVRREAALALGEVAHQKATAPLLLLLRNDKVVEVRSAAAIGLGGLGDTAAVGPLVEILKKTPRESDEFLRRSAARSIGQIAQFIFTGTRDVVTPQNFLPDRYKDLKRRTATGGDNIAFLPAIGVLVHVLENSRENDDTRREAAFALGAIGDRSALPALIAGTSSPDRYLAEVCREAIAKINGGNPTQA
ncbi:MAG TPA: HEAT repeat domain-containing protein [Pyrinomonadaceae bacterium]|nr:HEAT repeat domain-containing protein [Pyrinomonadaceae bacterium]